MYELIVFLPLLGFLIAGIFGPWIGARGAEYVTTGLLGVSFFLSWIAFVMVAGGADAHVLLGNWFTSGKLVATCTTDKWEAVSRACVVSAVPREQDFADCFPEDENRHTQKFGFPASGVAFKSGVFECDQLAAVVDKIANCEALDKDLREGLRDQFAEQLAMWLDGFGGRRDRLASTCKEMVTSYNDAAKERGCKM